MDRVREDDRAYFVAHPRENLRRRPYIPGESWPYRLANCDEVIVKRVEAGTRLVTPIMPGGPRLVWGQIDSPAKAGPR